MPTPIPELLPQIVTLNVPDQPSDPLFGWLQSHGWSHKGFLSKLFAH